MKQPILFLLILIVSIISGCSSSGQAAKTQTAKAKFVKSGRIVNPPRLREGGRILLVPFSAGANVEANEELDKISLMVIRGILDTIGEDNPELQVVYSDADRPDLVLNGHITKITEGSGLKKWMLLGGDKELSVKGRVIDRTTGHTIVFFTDLQNTEKAKEDHRLLALKAGQNIGRFILSGLD